MFFPQNRKSCSTESQKSVCGICKRVLSCLQIENFFEQSTGPGTSYKHPIPLSRICSHFHLIFISKGTDNISYTVKTILFSRSCQISEQPIMLLYLFHCRIFPFISRWNSPCCKLRLLPLSCCCASLRRDQSCNPS